MARAIIKHTFADNSSTYMEFELDSSFPDAAAEVVARVKDLYRETVRDDEPSDG